MKIELDLDPMFYLICKHSPSLISFSARNAQIYNLLLRGSVCRSAVAGLQINEGECCRSKCLFMLELLYRIFGTKSRIALINFWSTSRPIYSQFIVQLECSVLIIH